jgi:hypothetical protein
MKITILLFAFLSLIQCAPNPENANAGSQASQDYPSNREIDSMNHPQHDTGSSPAPTDTNSGLKSEAPNNGNKNPHQSIQGQTGTNQTGSKK